MTYKNYMKSKFWCPQIKSYWNTAIVRNLHIVCTIVAELNSCERNSFACLWSVHTYLPAPERKSLPTRALKYNITIAVMKPKEKMGRQVKTSCNSQPQTSWISFLSNSKTLPPPGAWDIRHINARQVCKEKS